MHRRADSTIALARADYEVRPGRALKSLPTDATELAHLAIALAGHQIPDVRMTESEFVEWCPDEVRAEWVDGKVVLMSPSNTDHDDLTIWLIRLIGAYVEDNDLGRIYQNVFVRFTPQRVRRVPDLLFIDKSRVATIKPTYVDGPPDLVIEVISPDSQSRDRRDKYLEYEKAGVREYWIIDPLSRTCEVSRLEKRKFLPIEPVKGVIASRVIRGFKLKTDLLWKQPLPKVSAVLKNMRKG